MQALTCLARYSFMSFHFLCCGLLLTWLHKCGVRPNNVQAEECQVEKNVLLQHRQAQVQAHLPPSETSCCRLTSLPTLTMNPSCLRSPSVRRYASFAVPWSEGTAQVLMLVGTPPAGTAVA